MFRSHGIMIAMLASFASAKLGQFSFSHKACWRRDLRFMRRVDRAVENLSSVSGDLPSSRCQSSPLPAGGLRGLRNFARRNPPLRKVFSARFRVHKHLYRNALRRSGVLAASAKFRDSCEISTVAGDGAECFASEPETLRRPWSWGA